MKKISPYLIIVIILIISSLSCNKNQSQGVKLNNRIFNFPSYKNFSLENIDEELSLFFNMSKIERHINVVKKYEQEDIENNIDTGIILFVGSSSIYKWKSLQNDMSPAKVLNRGIGGTTIPEAIYFFDKIIYKYKPSKIFFYEGENDQAEKDASPTKIYYSFILFHNLLTQKLPHSKLYYISIKPSVARKKLTSNILKTNSLIKRYIKNYKKNIHYIDICSTMLDSLGKAHNDLFAKDNLHLNEKGYNLWTKKIKPYVIER